VRDVGFLRSNGRTELLVFGFQESVLLCSQRDKSVPQPMGYSRWAVQLE
jgi:hypothetical protein